MFLFKENAHFLVDYFTGESTRLHFDVYAEAFEWHKKNKINFNERTYETARYNFADDAVKTSLRMEIVSHDYKKCLHFLKLEE